MDWFKTQVEQYFGRQLSAPRDVDVTDVDDHIGWHEQGDGKLFLGININCGRIKDEGDLRINTGLPLEFTGESMQDVHAVDGSFQGGSAL